MARLALPASSDLFGLRARVHCAKRAAQGLFSHCVSARAVSAMGNGWLRSCSRYDVGTSRLARLAFRSMDWPPHGSGGAMDGDPLRRVRSKSGALSA